MQPQTMANNNGNSNNTSKSSSFLLTAKSGSTSSQYLVFLEIGFGASFLRNRAVTDALAADIPTAATTATTTAGPRKYSQYFLASAVDSTSVTCTTAMGSRSMLTAVDRSRHSRTASSAVKRRSCSWHRPTHARPGVSVLDRQVPQLLLAGVVGGPEQDPVGGGGVAVGGRPRSDGRRRLAQGSEAVSGLFRFHVPQHSTLRDSSTRKHVSSALSVGKRSCRWETKNMRGSIHSWMLVPCWATST
jgi:hypothetical protein